MRILSWIFVFPLTLIAVSFALSNRETVLLTLWPFPFEMRLPVFAVGVGGLVLGFLAGVITLWGLQLRARLRNRRRAAAAPGSGSTPGKAADGEDGGNTQAVTL